MKILSTTVGSDPPTSIIFDVLIKEGIHYLIVGERSATVVVDMRDLITHEGHKLREPELSPIVKADNSGS